MDHGRKDSGSTIGSILYATAFRGEVETIPMRAAQLHSATKQRMTLLKIGDPEVEIITQI